MKGLMNFIITGLLIKYVYSNSFYDGNQLLCGQESDNYIKKKLINCTNEKYRTIDGSCNNVHHPTLGMAFTSYKRLLPANYGDNISSMAVSVNGHELPSARMLSFRVFGRHPIPDNKYSLLNMQWGQLVTHDTTIRLPDSQSGLKEMKETTQICCSESGRYETRISSSPCFPIPVPKYDPIFKGYNCINFDRSLTDKGPQCSRSPTPAEQLNGVTHYIDLSFVYGSTKADSEHLRSFKHGLLLTDGPKAEWPPRALLPQAVCPLGSVKDLCYNFGDLRGNQNPGLASLQIVLLREHNRIATKLASINQHWNDETLYQEARRINIAQFQHITYYEWIPNLFGTLRLLKHGIISKSMGGEFVDDYDPYIDPRGIQSFHHAAFRYFHNQIVGHLRLFSESRKYSNESYRLTQLQDRPGLLETECKHSSFVRGLSTQPAWFTDKHFDIEGTDNFVFTGSVVTRDLRTVDIQRSRDHGLASYNDYRQYCGLKRAKTWLDYLDVIPKTDLERLQRIYESHEDVDLVIGAALERHEEDALLGPTFLCINLKQFKDLRQGDRYFYENGNQPHPFTKEQLLEIRKSNVARLLCNNADIKYMQPSAFRRISKRNTLRSCSRLPTIDLRKWKDPVKHTKNDSILDLLLKAFTDKFTHH